MPNTQENPEYILNYVNWPQVLMTQEEWNKLSNDFKGIREDGTKVKLIWETGVGSTLAVVTITGNTSRDSRSKRKRY